jgi:hypothetical protein
MYIKYQISHGQENSEFVFIYAMHAYFSHASPRVHSVMQSSCTGHIHGA